MSSLKSLDRQLEELKELITVWQQDLAESIKDEAKFKKRGNKLAGKRVRNTLQAISKGSAAARKNLLLRAREMDIFQGTPRQASYKKSKHSTDESTQDKPSPI